MVSESKIGWTNIGRLRHNDRQHAKGVTAEDVSQKKFR